MTEKKKYIYADENANIHILTEDDLPKCPKNGEISPSVWIIGNKPEPPTPEVEHINCRCSVPIFRKEAGSDRND